MAKILTPDSYATARDRLAELEAEAAGVEVRIADATRRADTEALTRLWARRAVLPSAIEQARDALAPLELAHAEAQIAALDAPLARLSERIAALDTQIADLHTERGHLVSQVQEHQQRRQDLDHLRRRAWRRAQTIPVTT